MSGGGLTELPRPRHTPVVHIYRRYNVTLADETALTSRTYSVTVPSRSNPEEAAADEAREMWSDEFGSYGDVTVGVIEET